MTERIGAIARIREDLAAAKLRDPAARSSLEIALLYPGLHAVWAYRLWHALWVRRVRFVARLGSQVIDAKKLQKGFGERVLIGFDPRALTEALDALDG